MSVGMKFVRLSKSPGDDLPFNWDFSDEDVFADDPIVSATVTQWDGTAVPASLTVGAPVPDSPIVQTRISGGTDGTRYRLKCKATSTNAAYDREAFLELYVRIPTPDPE